MTMSRNCSSRCKIVFDLLRLSFNEVNSVFMLNTNMLVEQCTLMHMIFGNDHGARLLEYVCLLEQIR